MATIEEIFKDAENGTMTLEQFTEKAKKLNAKFADLSEGGYISKGKHDDEISGLNKQIETLNGTIGTRDKDLADIKKKLEETGTADAEKLTSITNDLNSLQSKYDTEVKQYKEQLETQAYEFAVKEFAGSKKFSSGAAKRDFINQMIQAKLKMKDGSILGATDFVDLYSKENGDAFVKDEPKPEDNPAPAPAPGTPHFVAPTPGGTPAPEGNQFMSAFHFAGVRPVPTTK